MAMSVSGGADGRVTKRGGPPIRAGTPGQRPDGGSHEGPEENLAHRLSTWPAGPRSLGRNSTTHRFLAASSEETAMADYRRRRPADGPQVCRWLRGNLDGTADERPQEKTSCGSSGLSFRPRVLTEVHKPLEVIAAEEACHQLQPVKPRRWLDRLPGPSRPRRIDQRLVSPCWALWRKRLRCRSRPGPWPLRTPLTGPVTLGALRPPRAP